MKIRNVEIIEEVTRDKFHWYAFGITYFICNLLTLGGYTAFVFLTEGTFTVADSFAIILFSIGIGTGVGWTKSTIYTKEIIKKVKIRER